MSFVHLHVHSNFSVLDGMSRIEDIVDKAIKYNMPAVALTDHGVMYGVKEFLDYVKRVKSESKSDLKSGKISQEQYNRIQEFKPIVGVEAYCAARTLYDKDKREKVFNERKNKEIIVDMSGYHLILLAKNRKGYENLCKLVSVSWTDGFYQRPRIDKNILEQYSEGVIVSSACLGGEIPQHILNNDIESAEATLLWFKRVFGDDFYLEIQLHKPTRSDVSNETYLNQLRVNEAIVSLAKKTNTKIIATNDVHFVEADHADAHERLVCLSTGKKISDSGRMTYTKEEYMKTPEQMSEIFGQYPEAISNTLEIAEKITPFSLDSNPIMPKFEIPQEFGTQEEYDKRYTDEELVKEFTINAEGKEMAPDLAEKRIKELGGVSKLHRIKLEADYLAKLTYEGAKARYSEMTPEIKERIDFELNTIKSMGFPGYFLIVQDFVRAARSMDVWVGPGRGSAAGSVAAYCLGITNIDPFKYDLLFERFLNPDRISLPDIDIDFDNDGLPKVLEWVTNKYGKECVAHIINYGTMATKLAITDVGRIQEVPLAEVNALKNLIPDTLEEYKDENGKTPKMNIKNILKYCKEVQDVCKEKPHIAEMMKYAEQLEGTVRQTGVHACGVIIAPDDLTKFVPLSTAKDKEEESADVLVTQYDGHVIEKVGLIKMDFLALKTLSIMKETVANIKRSKGVKIDINNIDWNDKATFDLFAQGNTVGVFQFESSGMQKYLKELHPSSIEDLIAMNALYRPGPMDYIPDFIDRKHGRMPITYDIPVMEKYLKDTYGITVYQEQVMLLSRQLANFTRGESDQLRKAMGKKIKELLAELRPKFIEGGKSNGHDIKILEKIWEDWEKFASYAFNKSHSTCYAILAYQTAYLKAHYPAEFMAANLTLNKDKIVEVNKFMEECRTIKTPVLLPDINESELSFTVNDKGEIRFGLGGIKHVGEAAVDSIIAERRKNGSFTSIFNFLERVNLKTCNKKTIESLVYSGAFDCFTELKREDFFADENTINSLLEWGRNTQAAKISLRNSLFGEDEFETSYPTLKKSAPWSDLQRLNIEKEYIGIYLSAHPLDKYRSIIQYGCSHSIIELKNIEKEIKRELDSIPNHEILFSKARHRHIDFSIGGIILGVRHQTSSRGNRYAIFSMEDYTDQIELRLFDGFRQEDRIFSKYGEMLEKDAFVIVKGTIVADATADKVTPEKIYRNVKINIKHIELVEDKSDELLKKLTIYTQLEAIDQNLVEELTQLIVDNAGNTDFLLQVSDKSENSSVMLRSKHRVKVNTPFLSALEQMAKDKRLGFAINSRRYEPPTADNEEDDSEDSASLVEEIASEA